MNSIRLHLMILSLFMTLSVENVGAQPYPKEYLLGGNDCAIVKFHITDTCPCASYQDYYIYHDYYTYPDSLKYGKKIFACKIDSLIMMHAVGDYINWDWLRKVNYIVVRDSISFVDNMTQIGSILVEFDMDYVILTALLDEKTQIVEIYKDGHTHPAGFACDWEDMLKAREEMDLARLDPLTEEEKQERQRSDERARQICDQLRSLIEEKLSKCRK